MPVRSALRAPLWALLGLLVVLAALAGVAGARSPQGSVAPAAATPAADLVVDFGDGRVAVRRVLVEEGTTGLRLLEGSGLTLAQAGGAVCALGGLGCPATDCFCQCTRSTDCRFWAYHHGLAGGGWSLATTGPAEHAVAPGALEGWVWGGDRPPVTATAEVRAIALGFDWLAGRQLPNGSVGDHAGLTSELVLAARAAGRDPAAIRAGGPSAIDFLRHSADAYSRQGSAQAGKLAAAAVAGGQDPRDFGAVDLVARVVGGYEPVSGRFGQTTWDQAWAMIGLAAAGEPVPEPAVDFLVSARAAGGGWGGGVQPAEGDPDSTGLAMQALRAAGAAITGTGMTSGVAFLDGTQQGDGGWGYGGASNTNSTAYALQGLLAAGEDPRADRWTAPGGATAVTFLLEQQRNEGHFEHDSFPADLMATLQVLPALAGRTLPLPGTAVATARAASWMLGQRHEDGSYAGFNPGATIDALLALDALGLDPTVPAPSGQGADDYLAAQAATYSARGPSAAGKLLAGVVALGGDPGDFGTVDLVGAVQGTYDPQTGRFGPGGTWDQAWAILGLTAAGQNVPAPAADALRAAAAADGGWGFDAAAETADADSTGLALQALAAAGISTEDPAVRVGILALRRRQNPDGGFAGYGGTTSAASTAMAIGGLVAHGQVVIGPGWMRSEDGGLTPLAPADALMRLQSAQGGFAGFAGPDDPGATYAAALALSPRPTLVKLRQAGRAVLPVVVRLR
jgi:hypothetical protein